ncbi:hypothetical protein [Ascidiaceihabitans sp.]|uniref:hypothetical protein n=1 Tax=Ascidiaceihabitans sp. TaxID=1872644 RepID=UPI0032989A59
MKTVEDPKYIALQAAVGATVALMHGPVALAFVISGAVALALWPYFLLFPTVSLRRSFSKSNRQASIAVLKGNSNIPERQARVIVLAMIVSGCLFSLMGLILCEVLLPDLFGLTLRNRNGITSMVLAGGLFALFKTLQWYAKTPPK